MGVWAIPKLESLLFLKEKLAMISMTALLEEPKPLTYPKLLLYSVGVGLVGGVLATLFYLAMKVGFALLWNELPSRAILPSWDQLRYRVWIITGIGGLLVGLVVKYLGAAGGLAGAVKELHETGKLDYTKLLGTALASWLSLTVGSSAGPESPLIDINGGVGSWIADRLKLSTRDVRILTLCGMGAGMGVFFSAPLGAALFVLEIPHRRGLEFFEAIIPTLMSAVLGFIVFRCTTGVTFGGIYDFPPYEQLRPVDIGSAVLLGIIGAGVGLLFLGIDFIVQRLVHPLRKRPLLLITLGGLAFGLIAMAFPITLFYGEAQIQEILDTGMRYSAGLLFLVAIMKMLALSLSLQSGFKGGVVFPVFFVGASVGMGIHHLIPSIPLSVALACMMAAVAVSVVNAPMGMIMILSTISHTSITPLITTAVLTSFVLTQQFSIVPTQQSRQDLN